jgi:hypothetical protein
MEFVGEVIATVMGLNTSNYQWVIDSAAEDERRAKRRVEVERSRREIVDGEEELKETLLAHGAEAGKGSDDDDYDDDDDDAS